jgi:hypothetical protein
MATTGEIEVRLDPRLLGQFLREVRGFSPELAKTTRKRLREAAVPAVNDVKKRLMGRTFKTDTGLAAGLAAGTKLSIRTGVRTAGISITTTGAKLPADKQAMVRAFDKPTIKHPVFGRRVWVTQKGRPYFGSVLEPKQAAMRRGVELAVTDALATVRTGTVSGR